MRVPGLFQRPADKSDIIGCTASAAGLGNDHGQTVGVIISGQDGLHDLAHHHQGGVACIVVYIF